MELTTIAIDLAKRVFQIHFVDPDTAAFPQQGSQTCPTRAVLANRPASRVVMEACGSADHWARVLARLGHEVRLIAAPFVRTSAP
ncbi:hypothetical protein CBA19CS91_26270 [Paraburkholderia hospita]|nr:hypothetical protein CBA19CS91_26270 [Paraburkholderia hospita]